MQGQGLSDLSRRCHPTPEHTQHTPPWHPEQRRAQASSPQLRAVWHHGLRSHLQPQELLGSSTLAACAAGQHPTRTTGNCQHQPVRENHSHYTSRKVSKGHSFQRTFQRAHPPFCSQNLLHVFMVWELPAPPLDALTSKYEVCWSHRPSASIKLHHRKAFPLLAQRNMPGPPRTGISASFLQEQ